MDHFREIMQLIIFWVFLATRNISKTKSILIQLLTALKANCDLHINSNTSILAPNHHFIFHTTLKLVGQTNLVSNRDHSYDDHISIKIRDQLRAKNGLDSLCNSHLDLVSARNFGSSRLFNHVSQFI